MEKLIGQTFGSWKVIAKEVTDKKYNYNMICRCDCGEKKIISKHNLINNSYTRCTKCKSNSIIDKKMDIITQRWDITLNKFYPLSVNLDTNKLYWFKCAEGHLYQSSIFKLTEECPKCEEEKALDTLKNTFKNNFDDMIDYLDVLWSELFENVEIILCGQEIFKAINHDLKVVIIGVPKRYQNMLYITKDKCYDIKIKIKNLRADIPEGYELFLIDTHLKFKDDRKILFNQTKLILV